MFAVLKLLPYRAFKRKITVTRKELPQGGFFIISAVTGRDGYLNLKKISSAAGRYSDFLVMPENFNGQGILKHYNTGNFMKLLAKREIGFKTSCYDGDAIAIKDTKGRFLALLPPLINRYRLFYIGTENLDGFLDLCDFCAPRYGAEPIYAENEAELLRCGRFIDLDRIFYKENAAVKALCEDLEGIDKTAFAAALYEKLKINVF